MADEQEGTSGTFKVWITKYALTDGIRLIEAKQSSQYLDMMSYGEGAYDHAHGEGREWHRTPESALRRAEEMRKKKLASLRKSIAKLEAMTFVAPMGGSDAEETGGTK